NVTHTYAAAGAYSVKLTAIDEDGQVVAATQTLNVADHLQGGYTLAGKLPDTINSTLQTASVNDLLIYPAYEPSSFRSALYATDGTPYGAGMLKELYDLERVMRVGAFVYFFDDGLD